MAKRKTRKRRVRRNPSSRRRRVVRRVSGGFRGLNFRSALKNCSMGVIGMMATKWAAKLGQPDALESDPSTWNGMTYLKGGAGAIGAGVIANMIKPGSGQKVLEGGIMLLLWKLAQNHLIPKSQFLKGQLGYGFGNVGAGYQPGMVETNEAGEPFILGEDGQTWIPMDDGSEMMGGGYYGEEDDWTMLGQNALEPPGRLGYGFDDVLEVPGRLGAPMTQGAYQRALLES